MLTNGLALLVLVGQNWIWYDVLKKIIFEKTTTSKYYMYLFGWMTLLISFFGPGQPKKFSIFFYYWYGHYGTIIKIRKYGSFTLLLYREKFPIFYVKRSQTLFMKIGPGMFLLCCSFFCMSCIVSITLSRLKIGANLFHERAYKVN